MLSLLFQQRSASDDQGYRYDRWSPSFCIVNEFTAAAITYGSDKEGSEQRIVIYNLGGGAFRVSLLSTEDGIFEALATAGERVVDYFVKQSKKKTGMDASNNLRALGKLERGVKRAKHGG